jgi:hypothetical protein
VLASRSKNFLPESPEGGKNPVLPGRKQGMTVQRHATSSQCRSQAPLDVTGWRRCRLLEAGFPAELAQALAVDTAVDLHRLLELVDRGCPPALAARILSPLPQVRP